MKKGFKFNRDDVYDRWQGSVDEKFLRSYGSWDERDEKSTDIVDKLRAWPIADSQNSD